MRQSDPESRLAHPAPENQPRFLHPSLMARTLRGLLAMLFTGTLALGADQNRADAYVSDVSGPALRPARMACPFDSETDQSSFTFHCPPLPTPAQDEYALNRYVAHARQTQTEVADTIASHDHAENQRAYRSRQVESEIWQRFGLSQTEWQALQAYTPAEVINQAVGFDRNIWAFTRTLTPSNGDAAATIYWRQQMAPGPASLEAGWVMQLAICQINTTVNNTPFSLTLVLEGHPDKLATRQALGAVPVTAPLVFSPVLADRMTDWLTTLPVASRLQMNGRTLVMTYVPELASAGGSGVVTVDSYTRSGQPAVGASLERLHEGQVWQYRVYVGGQAGTFDADNNMVFTFALTHMSTGGIGQPLQVRQGIDTFALFVTPDYRTPPVLRMGSPVIIQQK